MKENNSQYKFIDGIFVFYTAIYGSWQNDARIVFRVRIDRDPKERAKEKNIKYFDRIILSNKNEIVNWFNSHLKYKLDKE